MVTIFSAKDDGNKRLELCFEISFPPESGWIQDLMWLFSRILNIRWHADPWNCCQDTAGTYTAGTTHQKGFLLSFLRFTLGVRGHDGSLIKQQQKIQQNRSHLLTKNMLPRTQRPTCFLVGVNALTVKLALVLMLVWVMSIYSVMVRDGVSWRWARNVFQIFTYVSWVKCLDDKRMIIQLSLKVK